MKNPPPVGMAGCSMMSVWKGVVVLSIPLDHRVFALRLVLAVDGSVAVSTLWFQTLLALDC